MSLLNKSKFFVAIREDAHGWYGIVTENQPTGPAKMLGKILGDKFVPVDGYVITPEAEAFVGGFFEGLEACWNVEKIRSES
jgi:hypothetical protein